MNPIFLMGSSGPLGDNSPRWMRQFQTALDFRNGIYRLNNRRVSLNTIDSLYHTRASARRAEDSTGVSREFGNGLMALTDRGYDSSEGWTNLAEDPLMTGANPGNGTLPANWGTVASGTSIACVGQGVEDGIPYVDIRISGVPTGNVQIRFTRTNFITAAPGDVFTAEAAVRRVGGSLTNISWVDVRSCEAQSGTFLNSSDSAPFDLAAPRLGLANRFVTRTFNNASTNRAEARLRMQVTANQPVDITLRIGAPQFTRGGYHMPFGAGSIAPDSLVIPAPDAGLAVDPINDNKTLVMVWRGLDFQAAAAFPRLVDLMVSGANRMSLWRARDVGNIGATLAKDGATPSPSLATLAQQPRGAEFTAVAIWRPDGSSWIKAGNQAPVIPPAYPMLTGTVTSVGVGVNAIGGDRSNTQTRLAAIGAFNNISNDDALSLFNAVAAS